MFASIWMVLTNTAKNVNVVEALIPSKGKAYLLISVLVVRAGQRSERYQTNLEADDKTCLIGLTLIRFSDSMSQDI